MPSQQRDLVAPFVFGYVTDRWFGQIPDTEERFGLKAKATERFSSEYTLPNGIRAYAFGGGAILFDLCRCNETPIVVYRLSQYNDVADDARMRAKIDRRVEQNKLRFDMNVLYATSLITVHQCCLEQSFRLTATGGGLFDLVGWRSGLLQQTTGKSILYSKDYKKRTDQPVQWKTIEHSFVLLERILTQSESNLFRLVELYQLACKRLEDLRFAESLISSWMIAEAVVDYLWKEYVTQQRKIEPERFPKSRKENLVGGREYTAAIKLEFLENLKVISNDLYRQLSEARRHRNDLLHELATIDKDKAMGAIRTVEALLEEVFQLSFRIPFHSGIGFGGTFADVVAASRPDIVLPID